jgi:hypothetical protein
MTFYRMALPELETDWAPTREIDTQILRSLIDLAAPR